MRGIAIILMVVFHFFFDLEYFSVFSVGIHSITWQLLARISAGIFLFLVGLCLTISYARAQRKLRGFKLFKKYLERGVKLFALGMLITVATFVFTPREFIVFGVLHFIGVSVLLALPFVNRPYAALSGIAVILFFWYLFSGTAFRSLYLIWLGLPPEGFATLDYFPLVPWFGLVLFGIFAGNLLYPNARRRFHMPELTRYRVFAILSFLGRHSLLIYLLHQPVLIGIILLFTIL